MGLLLHRIAAASLLAFEALACLASVALMATLAAAPLYASYLPFEPAPWQWAAAFGAVCAVAVAASWVRGIFDRRLPARIGGEPRHAHISGWTFIWIVAASSIVIAIANWAARSETNRETINTELGETILVGLAIAFVAAALIPRFDLADRVKGVTDFVGRLISPAGRVLSVLDSILVFAVAGAAGVSQGSLFVRYLALLATLGACAAMGYWLEPPWGLAPLAWGFLVAIAISRRWAWIETDRELAMLNRRFVGPHLRIGFGNDVRDEALLSFGSLLLLVPLALRQAQIAALNGHFDLFNVDFQDAENLRTWIGFFGAELAKAVPFVDWAEVYDVSGAKDGIVRSVASQHFVFATRILVDFVFLAALLQALAISARDAAQRGLFYEGQLDRLDPFLEPREFRKLMRRGAGGRLAPDPRRLEAFPAYDPIRLSELAGDARDPLLRRAVHAVRVRQGGANVEAFHRELAERVRAPQRDKAAILEVIHAIRAAGSERDVALLSELRQDLNGVGNLLDVRTELARLLAEAGDGPAKAQALADAIMGARDTLGPVRLVALSELAEAAQRGDAAAADALEAAQDSALLSEAEQNNIAALLRRAQERPRRPTPVSQPEGATPRRVRKRSDALEWTGLAAFAVVGAAAIYVWQHPALLNRQEVHEAVVAPAPPPTIETPATRAAYRDCAECPEMAPLTGGAFRMGAADGDAGRQPWETPQHDVTLAPFSIGAREVTFAEWDACVAGGGCGGYRPPDRGWGRGSQPVMMVSWRDAQRYVRWLSERTGRAYRLPSEAEWEYAARAGGSGAYWWDETFDAAYASAGRTVETGSTPPNRFGLYEVSGNVAEWVEDCYRNNYLAAPADGVAVRRGDCARRVVRGGSWRDGESGLRVASRSRVGQAVRDAGIGFRVAVSDPS
jgi:formylglycine-generating enzyme required for sulfatase activity